MPLRCPTCGRAARPDARFCGGCGSRLAEERTCAACGSANPPDNDFCDACGRSLREPPKPVGEEAPPPERDPRSYTPEHLVQKILAGGSSLEGERKQVTVLFADVMGSMDLSERTDPETWRHIMDRFITILCEGVHRFEGTVDKFTGDGIMALFGAPIAHEDHAARAGYAALHLTRELARYANELRRERALNFSVRMGINSGEVIVGTIGEDLRLDYTALGHTVGLAKRMESLAEPGKAYVTEHTAALLRGYFDLRDLGEFEVKGVSEPLRVWELVGVGRARTRLDLARARGFSRFVGRAAEMEALEAALARALEGDARVVGVVGEPGVGKSRLCHEFMEGCRARGLAVYEASGSPQARTVPFRAALEMTRGYFGVGEQDPDQTARERIAGRLLLLDPSFSEDLPLLFDFMGVADPERPAPRMDPDARQRNLLGIIKRLVQAHSRREPAVNLFEDLHWVDGGSEALLEGLIEALPGTRTLVVVNFRPEYVAEWMRRPYYQQLSLVPLGDEATSQLLGHLLGDDPSLARLSEEIRQRTRGNPFFIEELVQGLVEDGTLVGERGGYRLARAVESMAVPPTVHAVLAARIDRLSERDKSLLQAAAVVGKEFAQPVLERVAGLPEPELAVALRALVAGGFLYERSLYPEPEYAFKHPLTQEVAYGSQLAERRARVHAAVAVVIAEIYPDRLDEQAALLAHHWKEAGQALEAARWSARAAAWAGLSDQAEAVHHWREVRELAAATEETAETSALGLAARIWILQFAWRMGSDEREAAEVYAEGRELAERSGDDASLALLMTTYGGTIGISRSMHEAIPLLEEAARLAEGCGNPAVHMATMPFLIYSLFTSGRLRECVEANDRAIALAADDPTLGSGVALACPYAWCTMIRGILMSWRGRLAEGARSLDRAAALAREHGDVETEGWAYMSHAMLGYYGGNLDGVLSHAMTSLEIAERIGSPFSRMWSHYALGLAHVLHERWEAAEDALERSLELMEDYRTGRETEPWTLAVLSLAYIGRGEAALARATTERAIAVGAERGLGSVLPLANRVLAEALIRGEGPPLVEEAETALDRALAAAKRNGARAEEPFVHAQRGEIARLRGDATAEERELREAHRLFRECGATGHAEALERRLHAFA